MILQICRQNQLLESLLCPIILYSHTSGSGYQVHLFVLYFRWDWGQRSQRFSRLHEVAARIHGSILAQSSLRWGHEISCRTTTSSSLFDLLGPEMYFSFPCTLPSFGRQWISSRQQTAQDWRSLVRIQSYSCIMHHHRYPCHCLLNPCPPPNDLLRPKQSSSGCLFSFSNFKFNYNQN